VFGASPSKIEITAGKPGLWEIVTNAFPGAADFMYITKAEVKRDRYVLTAGGYKLVCRKDHAGVNYKVQGTEGEIVKDAMFETDNFLAQAVKADKFFRSLAFEEQPGLIMQVHDELVFEMPDVPQSYALIPSLQRIMEASALKYGVPAKTEAKIVRTSWDKGEKVTAV
jgi:DNA polymerase I-like protein with 3'-5' exonuclease and polymerase domains